MADPSGTAQAVRKRLQVVAVSLSLCAGICVCVPRAHAYQYEGFKWGTSVDEARRIIESSKKQPFPSGKESVLMYTDTIFDEPCSVELFFTAKTRELAYVSVKWRTSYVGESLKEILVQKYGKPSQPDVLTDEYYWEGASEYDTIMLEYSFSSTEVAYFGGAVYQRYLDQEKEAIQKERGRF